MLPAVSRGGGRTQAIDKFISTCAVSKGKPLVVLLLDSEEAFVSGNAIGHIINRDCSNDKDKAEKLRSCIPPNSVFLMVRTIEHWFLYKPDLLLDYFKIRQDKPVVIKDIQGKDKSWVRNEILKLTNDKYDTFDHKAKAWEIIGVYRLQDLFDGKTVQAVKSQPQLLLELLQNQ